MNFKHLASFVALACGALFASTASASLYTQNYGDVLPGYFSNDDNSFALSLPSFINFGSGPAPQLSVSNNGSVSTPSGLSIYAFGRDLDSRNDPLGLASIHYRTSGDAAIITWDRMGVYPVNYNERYTFQMVFKDSTVGLFYGDATNWASGCAGVGCSTRVTGQSLFFDVNTGATAAAFNDVPEPASLALVGAGLVAALAVRRRAKA